MLKPASEKADQPQVFLDDDVGDGVEDKANVVGVRGTGEMRVDLLLTIFPLVQRLELELDVGGRFLVGV